MAFEYIYLNKDRAIMKILPNVAKKNANTYKKGAVLDFHGKKYVVDYCHVDFQKKSVTVYMEDHVESFTGEDFFALVGGICTVCLAVWLILKFVIVPLLEMVN